jgi:hypothetical protein
MLLTGNNPLCGMYKEVRIPSEYYSVLYTYMYITNLTRKTETIKGEPVSTEVSRSSQNSEVGRRARGCQGSELLLLLFRIFCGQTYTG